MKRAWGPLVALSLIGLLPGCGSPPPGSAIPATTEILWDTWGVPHVFASDSESLFYAFGWAQAQAHGDLVLRLMGQARGRAAEYWGEEYLDSDRWVHTMGVPGRADDWRERQSPEFRRMLDAFCRGINEYVAAHGDAIDDEVEVVLPVTATDVLAHTQRVIHFTFVAGPGDVHRATRAWEEKASNAWAIAPERSASGHAILVMNPHLPWADLFTWFEAQLSSPEVDAYGATLVGVPFLGIAFNDYLGWTHTVNTHDGADLYELTLVEGGYRFDGETRPFEITRYELKVRQADGTLRSEVLEIRRSVHGPVVDEKGDRAAALRVVGLEDAGLLEQYWMMARAADLDEFETAWKRMQMPMFTVMYADDQGRILHLFGGRTPVRATGGWDDWAGLVPGETSETLWTDTHAFDSLPRVVDPESGWLQNANDPPWTTTFPSALDPADFPAYLAPRFMHFRAQRSARMLMEDSRLDFEEVVAYKHSTRMELADRLLDDLSVAVADHGDAMARRAMEVLETWDRTADAESRGGVLFARFVEGLGDGSFARPWSAEDPMTTPDGLADPRQAAAILSSAARTVEDRHGALDVPWGEVFRLRRGDYDLPANGGPGSLGIFRVVGYREGGGGRYRAAGGDSFVAVVEFGDQPRAEALMSYGNSSQPGSPHNGDQLELFARKRLRPVWRERAAIEAHLERHEELSIARR